MSFVGSRGKDPRTAPGAAGGGSARRLALVGAALALTACPRLDPMQRQAKVNAYEPSAFYADGLAMRHPPAGTVPYRALLDPAVETGVGADGEPLAAAPVPFDAALLARGKAKYEVSCAVCHGHLGDGGSQVALSMSLRRPPSLHLYRDRPDGYLYRVISEGFGLMPSYARSLSVQDRWAVVAYVRALQLSQHAPVDQLPPELRDPLQEETP